MDGLDFCSLRPTSSMFAMALVHSLTRRHDFRQMNCDSGRGRVNEADLEYKYFDRDLKWSRKVNGRS